VAGIALLLARSAAQPPDWARGDLDAAAGILLAGVALVCLGHAQAPLRARRAGLAAAVAAALAAGLGFAARSAATLGWDGLPALQGALSGTSIVLSGALTLAALALVGLGVHWPRQWTTMAPALVAGAGALSQVAVDLYDANPAVAWGWYSPPAMLPAVLVLAASAGILCARADGGTFGLLGGNGTGSALARRLLPFAVGLPLMLGWIRLQGQRAGLYDAETGLALFAASNIVIFAALVWAAAAWLNRSEASLAQERRFSDAALDSLPGIFYMYDSNLRFLRWNRNFEKVSGYSAAQIARMSPLDFFDGPEKALLAARISEVFESGASDVEADFVSSDGRRTPYYFTGLATTIDGVPCLLGTGVDISARKRTEDEVRQLNADLERRVAERTAELSVKNRELETFSYTVSHDLKAPLRGIDGYSRLLLSDHEAQLDDEGRRFLHNIRAAATQMQKLIDDLLAYSKVERRAVTLRPVSVRDTVQAVLNQRRHDLEGTQLAVDLAPEAVLADAEGLAMALRNLIDNAVKFSRKRPDPRIEIASRPEGGMLLLTVRDNGVGFDMKYQERIFQIFQRLHRADEFSGTGVGLAIVQKAMERMGGRVRAHGEPGKGATFELELPLAPAAGGAG
jgi:PAS domain S-box-containing protein